MVDQGVSVSTRDYRIRQLVDVRTRYDPPTGPRSNGLVLGERHLDGRQAAFEPAFAEHLHGRVDGTVERELLDQLDDSLVDLAVKPAIPQFML
jgi:hypothetical protein